MKSTIFTIVLLASTHAFAEKEDRVFVADGYYPIKVENRVSLYTISPSNVISIHKVNCNSMRGNSVPVMMITRHGLTPTVTNDAEVVQQLNMPPKNSYISGTVAKAISFLCHNVK
jgi:hypothetical protein